MLSAVAAKVHAADLSGVADAAYKGTEVFADISGRILDGGEPAPPWSTSSYGCGQKPSVSMLAAPVRGVSYLLWQLIDELAPAP